jgi:hypothetical protein
MIIPPALQENDRRFARDQARMLAEHLEGDVIDYGFVAKHALALLQIAEFAWESPYAVVHVNAQA